MELINVSETPMEIINPGNGLPGIAPCAAVPMDHGVGGAGGSPCDQSYLCGNYTFRPGGF